MKKKLVLILIALTFMLSACGQKSEGTTASDPSSSSEEQNSPNTASTDDLSSAFNVLMGTTDEPSVFDSYHIELVLDTPQANDDNTAVVNETISISADVAGKNVHIYQIDPGMTEPKEGYIIGDTEKEYKWVDGAWEETMGQIALGWAMWPLQLVMPYAYSAAVYSAKLGDEDVNGRSATVYELDTTKGDPAVLAGMEAWGLENMTGQGRVWIDKETGAMLKLTLAYTYDISNMDGSVNLGAGSGNITLEISQVNAVTVTSPQ